MYNTDTISRFSARIIIWEKSSSAIYLYTYSRKNKFLLVTTSSMGQNYEKNYKGENHAALWNLLGAFFMFLRYVPAFSLTWSAICFNIFFLLHNSNTDVAIAKIENSGCWAFLIRQRIEIDHRKKNLTYLCFHDPWKWSQIFIHYN